MYLLLPSASFPLCPLFLLLILPQFCSSLYIIFSCFKRDRLRHCFSTLNTISRDEPPLAQRVRTQEQVGIQSSKIDFTIFILDLIPASLLVYFYSKPRFSSFQNQGNKVQSQTQSIVDYEIFWASFWEIKLLALIFFFSPILFFQNNSIKGKPTNKKQRPEVLQKRLIDNWNIV